ncbi:hypothetical protein PHMEG_0007211 [Phytophthora megakarya]|uniref:Uncharacterized protein n=1 Tax=Phytophthora megakarya TaxID=4795 RepID=A0A225WP81_9STRA|nr:hypothetical protein PHMEG_0007211 [Phytophthora megakarya]
MAELCKSNLQEVECIARSTARIFVQAADGISEIVAQRDESNQPFISDPKVFPYQLTKMNMSSYSVVLNQHRSRLLRHYKLPEHIKAIGFCAGITSAFPNTATVESDFSLIGVEKSEYRTALTDFSRGHSPLQAV